MSNQESLDSIGALAALDGRALSLQSQVWLSPFRQTRIFLPVAGQRTQEYCLRFFISGRLKRNLCRVALLFGRWTGAAPLARKSTATDLDQHVTAVLPVVELFCQTRPYHLAFLVGSPGPYQKIAALIVPADDASKTFIKLSVHETADSMIASEAKWLTRLAAFPAVRGHVPDLLGMGHLSNGRTYLLTSVAPSLEPMSDFGEGHKQFLAALGHATQSLQPYGKSVEAAYIDGTLTKLRGVLGPSIYADLVAGWVGVRQGLAAWHGPLVLAHRDFAPWNIRQSIQGAHVFDWEYATGGANPLYDFFHFHLMQMVLAKKQRVSPSRMNALLNKAGVYAKETYPEAQWGREVVQWFLLAYLLGVVLFYTDADQLFDRSHPVLSTYLSLIQSRAHWLQV